MLVVSHDNPPVLVRYVFNCAVLGRYVRSLAPSTKAEQHGPVTQLGNMDVQAH